MAVVASVSGSGLGIIGFGSEPSATSTNQFSTTSLHFSPPSPAGVTDTIIVGSTFISEQQETISNGKLPPS